MYRYFVLAGCATIVAGVPAVQPIDFAAIEAAPSPSLTGPPIGVGTQLVQLDSADAGAAASAAVTSDVSAGAISTAVVVPDTYTTAVVDKRWLDWLWNWGKPTTTTSSTKCKTTSTTAKLTTSTPAPVTTTKATTTKCSSSASSTSSAVASSTSCTSSTLITSATSPTSTQPAPTRVACAVQPDGYGPAMNPDTPDTFMNFPDFHQQAQSAVTPSAYTQTFKDLNCSVNANSYLGLITMQTYDVASCSQKCDSTDGCTAFNFYVERDPYLDPSPNCTNPPSITNYKCTLWGSGVEPAACTNFGQWRSDFDVVITGSNGYEKTNTTTPPSQPGWQPPSKCGDGSKVHNHPSSCMGSAFFPGPYNVRACSNYANAQIAKNTLSNSPSNVCFFNSYMIKKNGIAQGTYCALFASVFQSGDATYSPGWQGSNFYGVESSFSWQLSSSS